MVPLAADISVPACFTENGAGIQAGPAADAEQGFCQGGMEQAGPAVIHQDQMAFLGTLALLWEARAADQAGVDG